MDNKSDMYLIRRVNHDELDMAFALIWRVFQQCAAPDYTDEGVDYFYRQFVAGQDFRDKFLNNLQTMYGSFAGDRLAGVLSISKNNHVSCVFVDKDYQRKGIATKLFLKVITELKQQGVTKRYTPMELQL